MAPGQIPPIRPGPFYPRLSKKSPPRKALSLCLFDEARPAFGAGNTDLPLAARYPQLLLAGGADEYLVFLAFLPAGPACALILQLPPELQQLLVLLLPGVNIAGEDAQIAHHQHRPAQDAEPLDLKDAAA